MKFYTQFILACLFAIITFNAKAIDLSPQSQVSIITCGPGDELYSIFGHSAIRIYDTTSGMDLVFNYGTFDFRTEGFYIKFVRGKLDYMLDVSSFKDFINVYLAENRDVKEQVLDLTLSEKQSIYVFLEQNYKGKNKYYKYDFFFDNCTSRVRDLLSKVLGDRLVWNQKVNVEDKTFRKILDDYIVTMPWVKFGFYLGLGSVTDRNPNFFEAMFLPDKLFKGLEFANIQGRTMYKPLVFKTNILYTTDAKRADNIPFVTPDLIFGLLLLLVLGMSYWQLKKGTQPYWLDMWLWTNTALAGVLVLFLWLGTDHKATVNNMNFLWANPLGLLALGTLVNKKVSDLKLKIQYMILLLNFNLAICSLFFFQSFHPAFVMIMVMLSVRAAVNIWSIKKASATIE
jgi:hypothetical protein